MTLLDGRPVEVRDWVVLPLRTPLKYAPKCRHFEVECHRVARWQVRFRYRWRRLVNGGWHERCMLLCEGCRERMEVDDARR